MRVLRVYRIHYSINGRPSDFLQPDHDLSEADAWHYACLHAGIGVLHNAPAGQDELVTLVRHAKRSGLGEVRCEEVISEDP